MFVRKIKIRGAKRSQIPTSNLTFFVCLVQSLVLKQENISDDEKYVPVDSELFSIESDMLEIISGRYQGQFNTPRK